MLDYQNMLLSKDKEVRDPVSGHAFPMSYNDMKADRTRKKQERQDSELASLITSMLK